MSDAASDIETTRAPQTSSHIVSFLSGGVGGISAVAIGHPFDLTKTRLQTAPEGAYTGALDVVKKTLARDGVKGMYRGMGPPLAGVTPIFAISFWAYDLGKKIVYSATPDRKSQTLSLGELAFAGFFSAIPTTLVAGPAERVKVLLQIQGQGGQYSGPTDVVRQLYREGGLKSVFRGTAATLARDGPGSAAYFVAYEVAKKQLTPAGSDPSQLNLSAVVLAGGLAGVAMWSVVIKSRLQSAPSGTYSGFIDCTRKTIAKDGIKALWKGFGPAMAFPANAATFFSSASRHRRSCSRKHSRNCIHVLTLYLCIPFGHLMNTGEGPRLTCKRLIEYLDEYSLANGFPCESHDA
ncbi:carnitine/acyl carnitine carrier [Rhizoctonia solani AG-1 IA]|uniref:Carnitine/acyl carnitine carrier n=1 Tax=Thanatephorus cucumeris (strain AG1-IA) TaxID=983506 RepID=L8WWW0_THACA|nr:carnitine/acyl carnitine carrier [Rhizoctonia solani AG-1 IA]